MLLTDYISEQDANELMERYYRGDLVSELLLEYDIPVTASKLITLFPPRTLKRQCPYCDENLQQKRPSKSAMNDRWHNSTNFPYCPSCNHTEIDETSHRFQQCHCNNCQEIRDAIAAQEVAKEQDAINRYLAKDEIAPVEYFSLNHTQYLYLATLLRGAGDESCEHIIGDKIFGSVLTEKGKPVPISPSTEFTREEMMMTLWNSGVIRLSDESPLDGFSIAQDDDGLFVKGVYLNKCWWKQNTTMQDTGYLLSPGMAMDFDECLDLWKKIAKAEIIRYLNVSRDEINLNSPIGPKTNDLIDWILERYSVAQAYNFIWRGVREALHFNEKNGISGKHASNMVISSIRRRAEKAFATDTEVECYGRTEPPSLVAQLFYDYMLGIGERGFTECPNMDAVIDAISARLNEDEDESSDE